MYEKYFSMRSYEKNLKNAVTFFMQKKIDIGKRSRLKAKNIEQIIED